MTVVMSDEQRFDSGSWWAVAPELVLETLRCQLKAASVVWPELDKYEIAERTLAQAQDKHD
jgi:hypothetical protein